TGGARSTGIRHHARVVIGDAAPLAADHQRAVEVGLSPDGAGRQAEQGKQAESHCCQPARETTNHSESSHNTSLLSYFATYTTKILPTFAACHPKFTKSQPAVPYSRLKFYITIMCAHACRATILADPGPPINHVIALRRQHICPVIPKHVCLER